MSAGHTPVIRLGGLLRSIVPPYDKFHPVGTRYRGVVWDTHCKFYGISEYKRCLGVSLVRF